MRKTLFMDAVLPITILLVIGGLVWEFVPIQKTLWDGGFDLAVSVSSSEGSIRSVHCYAFGRHEDADDAATRMLEYQLPPEIKQWSASADPFEGRPVKVNVPTSGLDSPLGRSVRYFQFRYLLVIAQWEDGRRVGKLVEIPDGRIAREISVSFP